MKSLWWLLFAILSGNALQAGAIRSLDISAETTATVHGGDTLIFHLFTWNFARNAARFDMPALPTDVIFALVTAPVGGPGLFGVTLESEDRSVITSLGDLNFKPGVFTSSGYSGEVSTLQGYLHISPELQETFFKADSIVVALRSLGPDLKLGLSPCVLPQNVFLSLSADSLSVGALPGWVELEEAQNQTRPAGWGTESPVISGSEVPEPGSKWLLAGGGMILCVLSLLLRGFSHSRA